MKLGPNFFIWIAIALVVVTTIPAVLWNQYWIEVIGAVIAVPLVVINKVRTVRRRRAKQLDDFS